MPADRAPGRSGLTLKAAMSSIQELPADLRHPWRGGEETHALNLTFGELVLIYKALQAVQTLDALPRQDELLNDTMELVDRALTAVVSGSH
jgi:hypothetical protein